MFENVYDEIEIENFESVFEQVNYSQLFSNIFTVSLVGGVIYNFKKISSYIFKFILHSPGVGKVNIVSSGKTKSVIVSTEIGDINLPIIKNPSFELNMGFFTENKDFKEGLHVLNQLDFPENVLLRNIGCYLVTDIKIPQQFRGKDTLYGFIISYLDGLVYIFKISNNKVINYKKIFDEYENTIEDSDIEPYCNETEPYCNETEPYCNETEPYCNETEPYCNETEPYCNETEPYCNETEPYCNETEPYCNETETYCKEIETCCKETETCCKENEPCCKENETCCKENEPSGTYCVI